MMGCKRGFRFGKALAKSGTEISAKSFSETNHSVTFSGQSEVQSCQQNGGINSCMMYT